MTKLNRLELAQLLLQAEMDMSEMSSRFAKMKDGDMPLIQTHLLDRIKELLPIIEKSTKLLISDKSGASTYSRDAYRALAQIASAATTLAEEASLIDKRAPKKVLKL